MGKSHASYKSLITRTLKTLNPYGRKFISPIAIKNHITNTFGITFLRISNVYFKRALLKMLDSGAVQKHELKYMVRMAPKSARRQKKPEKKENKKVQSVKKAISKKNGKKPLKKEKKSLKKQEKKQPETKKTSKKKAVLKVSQENGVLERKSSFKKRLPIWQFYDKFNVEARVQSPDGWYDYDKKASDIVEEEWQKYIKNRMMCDVRAVKSGHFEYSVDFMSWHQTNMTHHAHKVRIIRRLDENGNITLNPYE